MPSTLNGIGSSFCGYAAPIRWAKPGMMGGNTEDHDAMECVVVLFLPLLPIKAVHTFNWAGTRCQTIDLKKNGTLLAAAMFRPWLMALFVASSFGILISGTALAAPQRDWLPAAAGLVLSLGVFAGAVFGWRKLKSLHRRSRDLRLVMGPHPLGSSDPATWADDVLDSVLRDAPAQDARELVTAGQQALKAGNAPMAMWHARLAVGLGDAGGETLTDEILRNPEIVRKLDGFRAKPWTRGEHFPAKR